MKTLGDYFLANITYYPVFLKLQLQKSITYSFNETITFYFFHRTNVSPGLKDKVRKFILELHISAGNAGQSGNLELPYWLEKTNS